ncbi:MAG: beta-ketoacyl synthase N-terminal-like domain-containing protein [Candidatus Thermoplasmatota archaeon]|nr:beta-ketoacyl synthase N-terminal-like domain-containing protein [Candidatus Thermoplasmatota archaeon]
MQPVSIVDASCLKYGKREETARELAVDASLEVLEKAGVSGSDLDGLFVANAFGMADKQGHVGPLVATAIGAPNVPSSTTEAACASASVAFRHAIAYVRSGMADMVLAVGTEKVSHIDTLTATSYFCYGSDFFLEGGVGATFPGLYAAIARAHKAEYGTTESDLAQVAIKNHKNAIHNPTAHFHKEIDEETVLDSYPVATPLKLYDACPFSDGAAAAIITTPEKAAELTDAPITVEASAHRGTIAALSERDDMTGIEATQIASREALAEAGLVLDDIGLFEVHDCFTIAELVAMEDIGIAEPGKAVAMVRDGQTFPDGDRPVNASGGLKAKGHPVGATGGTVTCHILGRSD